MPFDLFGLWSAIFFALQAGVGTPLPYKTDGSWAYFRNPGSCMAASIGHSPSSDSLMMVYHGTEKFFQVGFTKTNSDELKKVDKHLMDIRLHRPGGVLDDGWEDVEFTANQLPDGTAVFMSQPMDIPAARDFAEMEAVVFIDEGKTAGSFKLKHPRQGVTEVLRCAKEQVGKP